MRIRAIVFTLIISEAQSLKDKRQVILSMITKLRQKFNISVAEVGCQDQWQRAELGLVYLGNQQQYLDSVQQEIEKLIEEHYPVEITELSVDDY